MTLASYLTKALLVAHFKHHIPKVDSRFCYFQYLAWLSVTVPWRTMWCMPVIQALWKLRQKDRKLGVPLLLEQIRDQPGVHDALSEQNRNRRNSSVSISPQVQVSHLHIDTATPSVYLIRLLLSLGTQHPLTPSFLCSVQEWLSFVLLWTISAPCPLSNFIAVLSKTFVWLHYLIYLLDVWLCGTGQLIIAEQSTGSIPMDPILISGSTSQVER